MRAEKEVQEWFEKTIIRIDNFKAICNWIASSGISCTINMHTGESGATLIDVIDFVNSPSPSKEKDLSPIVAQFAKVKKEVDKLQKLIAKL